MTIEGAAVLVILAYNAYQGRKIHGIVNSTSDKQLERIDDLTQSLQNGDIHIPKEK